MRTVIAFLFALLAIYFSASAMAQEQDELEISFTWRTQLEPSFEWTLSEEEYVKISKGKKFKVRIPSLLIERMISSAREIGREGEISGRVRGIAPNLYKWELKGYDDEGDRAVVLLSPIKESKIAQALAFTGAVGFIGVAIFLSFTQ